MLCATVEGSLPIAGGVEAADRAAIETARDPAAKRAETEAKLRTRRVRSRNPKRTEKTAHGGAV